MNSRAATTSIVLATFVALLCFWGIAAFNYGDEVAVGTYHFAHTNVTCELILKPDHSFVEGLKSGAYSDRAEGSWRRVGEGGISFSNSFLAVPGEVIEPDGTTFADMHKVLGLFVRLHLRRYHVLWYGRPDSQSGNWPVGTYNGHEEGVKANLTLLPDHSFQQEVVNNGVSANAKGTWSSGPNGAITFSRAFLKMSGKPLGEGESATSVGSSGADLQIMIANTISSSEPIFRKMQYLW